MFKLSISCISVFILVVIISCSTGSVKPGTGGTSTGKKIEKTEHQPVPEGVTCYVCHKRDISTYEFHKNYGNNCVECHDQNSWIALKYAHPEWFLNTLHKTRCTRCHTKANEHDFSSYQCYGCHHEGKTIKEEHLERGSENISECITCHKSSPGSE